MTDIEAFTPSGAPVRKPRVAPFQPVQLDERTWVLPGKVIALWSNTKGTVTYVVLENFGDPLEIFSTPDKVRATIGWA